MEQKVKVELQTIIEDNGLKETSTVTENGMIYMKDKRHLVVYEEKTKEATSTKNMLSIQPEKVSIKRSGAVKMNQLFRLGKRSENIFEHPHGRMHMETFTEMIDYQPFEGVFGQLTMHYTVKLNGQPSRNHHLTLTIKG